MKGDGRVYRREGSPYWWIGFWLRGKEIRKSTRTTSHRKAVEMLRAVQADIIRGDFADRYSPWPLSRAIAGLIRDMELNRRASVKTASGQTKHLLRLLGEDRRMSEITSEHLRGYAAERFKEGASRATVRMELHFLARAYRLGLEAGRVTRAAIPAFPQITLDPSTVRKGFVTRAELELICDHLEPEVADFVRFLFFSSWRVGEVRALTWAQYDRAQRVLVGWPERTKNRRPHAIPVAGEIAEILDRRWAARRLDLPAIFHRRGKRIGRFVAEWRRACERAGVGKRLLHDLRRSGVSHMVGAGIHDHIVMQFSGHRTRAVFQRYDIRSMDDMRDAAERAAAHAGPGVVVTRIRPKAAGP